MNRLNIKPTMSMMSVRPGNQIGGWRVLQV
jgi:hypothetical protein